MDLARLREIATSVARFPRNHRTGRQGWESCRVERRCGAGGGSPLRREVVPTDRHRIEHGRLSDRTNPYDAFGNDTGTTVNTRPIPLTEPAKWAGGTGSTETGPASTR